MVRVRVCGCVKIEIRVCGYAYNKPHIMKIEKQIRYRVLFSLYLYVCACGSM